ncbi:hypothetical protein, conserved in T. vivax [Trypanosoma vivax Y486]|uniref:Uncharacterized protein n=1 Tax=Trypanosoma vivax (strain Y486) TaxID=1055687 RepID=F9WTX7_TRYVY|nr:hypothetical protein, conserved in T. vivax [Trypanosoma vivax Y486]|eukprot:CCD21023.1 hypothetical protein, conserved in T. vivax [Trypanosoma vivax Y486]
MHMQALRG